MNKHFKFSDAKSQEWSVEKRWNPFNSYKLLAQAYRWEKIKRNKPIPQPVLVTVDPINSCNLRCIWCNSGYVLQKRQRKLSRKTLNALADFLPGWQGSPDWAPGVEAVCIAGGGEPLMNTSTGEFINRLERNGVQSSVITNGSLIGDYMDPLSNCVWVGVSVDAGTSSTFTKLKGVRNTNTFQNIIDGIANLVAYSNKEKRTLARKSGGYGVSFKYLLHSENVGEIYEAARIAKVIGCKNFHMRPASPPWDKLGCGDFSFSAEERAVYDEQVIKARELEDSHFGVYGITHKFDDKLMVSNVFKKCHAIFMTAVFMPSEEAASQDSFTIGLCCDRRGDVEVELRQDARAVNQIDKLWGSKKHWEIYDKINVASQCPRCTYQPHNQIYEKVILEDSMTFRFI